VPIFYHCAAANNLCKKDSGSYFLLIPDLCSYEYLTQRY
jgi:hypothetical protein